MAGELRDFLFAQILEDRDRPLRERVALREVVRLHSQGQYGHVDKHLCHDSMTTDVECETLRELAVIWAGHPDYQPAWKPYR